MAPPDDHGAYVLVVDDVRDGATAYLQKPFRTDDLHREVVALVGPPSAAPSPIKGTQ